ncbi:hypothetical protein QTP70_006120 [Hemibagrus guttatus]|uniref:Uncharacterized protein n=1 Tax=Hemibagrus guttatus TaxID=175788 RepID=A0AAE0R5F9_9TELE|nr:hypothetical protein QTP70_006120 [Hemibagrus guttatus]
MPWTDRPMHRIKQSTALFTGMPILNVLNVVEQGILFGPVLKGKVTPVFLSDQGKKQLSLLWSFPLRPQFGRLRKAPEWLLHQNRQSEPQAQPAAQKPTGATTTPEEPCTAEPVTVKSCSAELVSIQSSAKVNLAKCEAILAGEWGGERPTLPGGLVWKKDGFKYLGVYLGNNEFLNKNREGTVEQAD